MQFRKPDRLRLFPLDTIPLIMAAMLLAGCAGSLRPAPQITWTHSGGPGDLQVRALLYAPDDPQTIYAGVAGYGFHRSQDGGRTWQNFTAGFSMFPGQPIRPEALDIRSLVVSQLDPTTILAGTRAGIFRSKDRGETWTPIMISDQVVDPEQFTGFFIVDSLATSLVGDAETFYAGTKGGLFRLGPLDDQWQPTELAGSTFRSSALLVDDRDQRRILVGTVAEGIFESLDGGATWNQIGARFAKDAVWIFQLAQTRDGRLFAGTFGRGVYLLRDGAWVAINNGLPDSARIWSLQIDQERNTFYVGVADDRTYRSVDGGVWEPIEAPSGFYGFAQALDAARMIGGTRGFGVYASADGGINWERVDIRPAGEQALRVLATLPLADGTLLAATDSNGVFRLPQKGNWQTTSGIDLAHRQVQSLVRGPERVDAGTAIYAGTVEGGVYRSKDHGRTWTQLTTDGLTGFAQTVASLLILNTDGQDDILAGTRDGLYRLRPGSESWENVRGLMDQLDDLRVISALATGSDGAIYASVWNRGIFRSLHGQEWDQVSTNSLRDPIFTSMLIQAPASLPGRILHGPNLLLAADAQGIYTSADGHTWQKRMIGTMGTVAVDANHPQVAFTAPLTTTAFTDTITRTFPTLVSLNSGITWQTAQESPAPLTRPINAMTMDSGSSSVLYAATDSGVYIGSVGLPILWREVGAWIGLISPLLLLVLLIGYAYITLTRPYGIPVPQALHLLLFRRKVLALALAEPSPFSSLQQLILAQGQDLDAWTAPQMAGLLEVNGAFATDAQLATALAALTDSPPMLWQDDKGRYRPTTPALAHIFVARAARQDALLAKDVREENRIYQDSRTFFQEAGFAVHTRQDVQLLTPLRESWADLAPDGGPLLARILSGTAATVADVDRTVALAGAEFSGNLAGRWLFLIVPATPEPAAHERIGQLHDDQDIHLVLLSHTAIAHALQEGSPSALVQTALRRHRGEVSPANLTGPVLDPLDFFDRRALLARIGTELSQGQHLIVTGPPQIGKTSLAWQAAQRLDSHLVAYGEVPPGPNWEEPLLAGLLQGTIEDGRHKFARTEWPFAAEEVPEIARSIDSFVAGLAQISTAIRLRAGRPQFALVIDGLAAEQLAWWQRLQQACAQSHLVVGLAGIMVQPLATERLIATGQNSQHIAVSFLSREGTWEMVQGMARQSSVQFQDDAIEALYLNSGGHPLLLRLLFGQTLTERGQEPMVTQEIMTEQIVQAAVSRHASSHPIYARWWGQLSAAEQDAVLEVVEGVVPVESTAGSAGAQAKGWLRSSEDGQYAISGQGLAAWLSWTGLVETLER